MILVYGITLAAFLLVIAGMAVGVIMGRREISGSCGGLANSTDPDGNTSCSLCSNPDAACQDLANRMHGDTQPHVERTSETLDCAKDCDTAGCSKEAIDACKNG